MYVCIYIYIYIYIIHIIHIYIYRERERERYYDDRAQRRNVRTPYRKSLGPCRPTPSLTQRWAPAWTPAESKKLSPPPTSGLPQVKEKTERHRKTKDSLAAGIGGWG